MPALVSAWSEEDLKNDIDHVTLVIRDESGIKFRRLPSRWSLFVYGLREREIISLERDPRVKGSKLDEHGYLRIDATNRYGRNDIVDALTQLKEVRPDRDIRVCEGDVSPLRRLLSDTPSLEVHESPRMVYLDIECDSRHSVQTQKDGDARVLSWAIADDEGNSKGAVLSDDSDEAERELFLEMFQELEAYDCIAAWYGSGYDFEVLEARAANLKVRPGGRSVRWLRWTRLDHLEVFKKYNMNSDSGGEAKSSFALNHVAGYLLGEGKIDFDSSKTWEAWKTDPQSLLEYNIRDAELLPRIEEKTGLISLHLAVCYICRIFPDTDSLNATKQGDGFLLRLGDEYGYRWPTKRRFDETGSEPFEGAYVMEPSRNGAIDQVHVCDFAGLYPSIIRTWNMSPDTKVDMEGAWGFKHAKNPFDDYKEAHAPTPGDLRDESVCMLPNKRTFFRTETDGMFRIALDRLVAKRAEYQAAMKKETPGTPEHERAKRLQGAFKIVANSFYGILGSPWSRFFDVDIAEGVTQTGQWLLKQVIAEAKTKGLDPFYGDTDSVFIQGPEKTMVELVELMNDTWFERLEEWGIIESSPMHIDLDFEKTFSRIVIISKKRYAGRFIKYKGKAATIDAKPEVKGLEFKRGDTLKLARNLQVEIVNKLLAIGEPFDTPLPEPSEMRVIMNRWKKRILHDELEPDDVILSKSVSKPLRDYAQSYTKEDCKGCGFMFPSGKDRRGPAKCPQCGVERKLSALPQHVRVAYQMIEDGHEVLVGNRIRYLVIRPERDDPERKSKQVPVYTPDAFGRIDREYYWKRVHEASARVLKAVYSDLQWADTTAERRERELRRRQKEFKGVISDLPLYAHFSIPDMDRDQSTEGVRQVRTRKRKRKTEEPRVLNEDDRKQITKHVKSGQHFDASAYAIEHKVKVSQVAAFAKSVPRQTRRRLKKKPVEKSDDSESPRPRRRLKKKAKRRDLGVVYRIIEATPAEDGGGEKYRRQELLRKLRETAEKHPGETPLTVVIGFPRGSLGEARRDRFGAKVVIPTGLTISTGPAAKVEFEKLNRPLSKVLRWPA